jgi:hypothetical protein
MERTGTMPRLDCRNSISKLSPAGTAENRPRRHPDNLQPSLRDLIMFHDVPRTDVLGLEFLHLREGGKNKIRGMREFSGSCRSDALYQGTTCVGPSRPQQRSRLFRGRVRTQKKSQGCYPGVSTSPALPVHGSELFPDTHWCRMRQVRPLGCF